MYLRLLVLGIIFNFSILQSQIPEFLLNSGHPVETKSQICVDECCKSKYKHFDDEYFQSNIQRKIYDVISYNLWLNISDFLYKADIGSENTDTLNFSGIQKIVLVIDSSGHNTFDLDAAEMNFSKVEIKSQRATSEINYNYKSPKLEFTSEENFIEGDTILIELHFSATRTRQRGIFFYPRSENPENPGTEPIIYTQSQPTFAHYWMPCNDKPYEKTVTNISLTVPVGFTALSNGNLDSLTSGTHNEINTLTYHYSHDKPISSYLSTVVASKYSYFEQHYPRFTDNTDTVKIDNYMWEIDLNPPEGHPFNAKLRLRSQPEMLKLYSSIFGEYSYDKYGTVAVFPYAFGGMEHQTMTTIHRNWIRYNAEVGLAHEVAHHWIGNLITCASWDDIWINEGGATWFEALWTEHAMQDENYYYSHMLSRANYYLTRHDAHLYPVYGVEENFVFLLTYITYNKAGWVYHMLSEIVGRKKFFETLNVVFENNKFLTVSTQDFIDLLKANIPEAKMDLDLFFEQWVYGSGHPIYEVSTSLHEIEEGKFSYDVYVSQVQKGEGYREVYEMPVEIIFLNEDGQLLDSEPVYNDGKSQKFSFTKDFKASSVMIDYRKVLCDIKESVVSVNDYMSPIAVQIAPNPVEPHGNVRLFMDSDIEIFNIRMYDLLGNEHNCGFSYGTNNIKAPANSGMYIVELNTNKGLVRKKVLVY